MPTVQVRATPALTPGVLQRTQPRTASYRPSYPIGSHASRLHSQGLTPGQIDRAIPRRTVLKGAGYAGGSGRNPTHLASSRLAATANNAVLLTGRAPTALTAGAAAAPGGSRSSAPATGGRR